LSCASRPALHPAVARCAATSLHRLQTLHWTSIVTLTLGLYGCGGGNSAPAQTYTLGGTVNGLTGSVVLENGGGNSITLAANGAFTFPGSTASGTAYSVTVGSQPANQTCTISHGSAIVENGNVTDIGVTCVTNTYTIGGTVTGLGDESGLVLSNEGSGATDVSALAVTFTMKTAVNSGTSYAIGVQHAPPGVHCDVVNGTGTIDAANVPMCGFPVVRRSNALSIPLAPGRRTAIRPMVALCSQATATITV
jgi:hypothetical protein